MTWRPKNQSERDWLRGVESALALVAEYDRYSSHDYRVSECVRSKLNLTNKRPRKTPRKNDD